MTGQSSDVTTIVSSAGYVQLGKIRLGIECEEIGCKVQRGIDIQ